MTKGRAGVPPATTTLDPTAANGTGPDGLNGATVPVPAETDRHEDRARVALGDRPAPIAATDSLSTAGRKVDVDPPGAPALA